MSLPAVKPTPALPPFQADPDRLERLTVCTRPFRAAGPRIEAERIGDTRVLHNYGHGGAGWSLSWGSAAEVLALAQPLPAAVAVVGCGALGLTAALALQRAGAAVTIYTRDLPSEVRSARATGLWSPDSRVALTRSLSPTLADRWETMARTSWAAFAQERAHPESGVAMHTRYVLSTLPPENDLAERHRADPIGFAHLEERLADLLCPAKDLPAGQHPFHMAWARRLEIPRFNISAYTEHLLKEFRARGGRFQRAELHTAADLANLREAVVVNCTGYAARALLGDESLTPVRGQIGWLPAQPEIQYSLQWNKLSVVARADGVVVQLGGSSDETGWNDAGEEPRRAESEEAVLQLRALQANSV